MSRPSLIEALAVFAKARESILEQIRRAKENAPEGLKLQLQDIEDEFEKSTATLDLESLQSSISSALAVLSSGHGISGGGADATLA